MFNNRYCGSNILKTMVFPPKTLRCCGRSLSESKVVSDFWEQKFENWIHSGQTILDNINSWSVWRSEISLIFCLTTNNGRSVVRRDTARMRGATSCLPEQGRITTWNTSMDNYVFWKEQCDFLLKIKHSVILFSLCEIFSADNNLDTTLFLPDY